MRRARGSIRAGLAALLAAAVLLPSADARAWDPSTTHVAMVERSVLDSALHLRWMEGSLLQRGLFTPLRLDPARLDDETRRLLQLALRQVHAASGAEPLGGPGACPGASAPPATRARCVEGDLWELTAVGWLELGVVVETVPRQRLLHHFVDRAHPASDRWVDDDLPRAVLRGKGAEAGGSLAARATGSAFEGSGRSAIAWLDDASDRWAPPALARHLRRASLAADRAERDHHLVMALLCTGALMHVVQDLSVPAHARGDVSAMFLPLSDIPGDRGLPLQELARDALGRGGLPTPVRLSPRPDAEVSRGVPLAPTLRGHLLGEGDYLGLVPSTARFFFSESSLPAARELGAGLDATQAAAKLLEGSGIDASEREGARMSEWPARRGYLLGASGRPLAAFRVDEDGQVRLWLDRRVYRAQMQVLIPRGVEAGRSLLDLLYAAWPQTSVELGARALTLTPGETWAGATLTVMLEGRDGRREAVSSVALTGAQAHRVTEAWPASVPEGSAVVLVLENPEGVLPAIAEHVLDLSPPEDGAEAGPAVPRPRAQPPTTRGRTSTVPTRGPKVAVEPEAEPEPEGEPEPIEPEAPGDADDEEPGDREPDGRDGRPADPGLGGKRA
ncbi:MAG: hypothetical protein H6712_07490 [Myxococcales bacterium]|nr:hypothetical protein [Myxococcales bacterium]MCB9713678.1 hypothetical protein [Myxococcales bacterium]